MPPHTTARDSAQCNVLESVRLPSGSGTAHALYMLARDGVSIARRVLGGGVADAARLQVSETGPRDVVVRTTAAAPRSRGASVGT